MPLNNQNRKLKVFVIHGDPKKYNPILPGGYWDEDDFLSLNKAKDALSSLSNDYDFTYYCNHDTLLMDLKENRDNIDLVLQLCDEGWFNHPKMEMHVVSYLEMLGIPYTGSGPQCLATTYDKQTVLEIAKSINVPIPFSILVENDSELKNHGLEYPII
ncbi:hypothetical protein ROZALSC1DRAFT_25365, partial [Rozella allomycis CSF55]